MEIVTEAVQLLQDKNPDENEPSLNKKLYQNVLTTYRRRKMRGQDTPDFAPAFDAPNPPVSYEFTPSENKRPDLRWDLVDHLSEPPIVRSFAVECKRLRSKSDAGWRFNRNYARHGILRFVALEHQYGMNMASGAMIGYWQNMDQKSILTEINAELDSKGLPRLEFEDLPSGSLYQANHILKRSFDMSPFSLRHLWLDMRDSEAQSVDDEASAERASAEPNATMQTNVSSGRPNGGVTAAEDDDTD